MKFKFLQTNAIMLRVKTSRVQRDCLGAGGSKIVFPPILVNSPHFPNNSRSAMVRWHHYSTFAEMKFREHIDNYCRIK